MSGRTVPDYVPAIHQRGLQATSALACLALVAAVMSGIGGGIGGQDASAGVTPTGNTTEIHIEAVGMRFTPESVTVPAGDRLVLTVVNSDDQVHDLVLATGHDTGRLAPGESSTLDVGVVGADIDGWCSIVGHRQQGMAFRIVAEGGDDVTVHHHGAAAGAPTVDLAAEPDADFVARDPLLAPHPTGRHIGTPSRSPKFLVNTPWVYRRRCGRTTDKRWARLRGRVGDIFEITMVNHGSMGHSIDFHAAWSDPTDRCARSTRVRS